MEQLLKNSMFSESYLFLLLASGTDDATLPLYGAGFAVPLPNRWAVALKFLRLTTNDYNQQDNPFAPKGTEPFRASAEDFAVLAAVSKGLGEKFGLGFALALYGKSTYDIAANDNTRHPLVLHPLEVDRPRHQDELRGHSPHGRAHR